MRSCREDWMPAYAGMTRGLSSPLKQGSCNGGVIRDSRVRGNDPGTVTQAEITVTHAEIIVTPRLDRGVQFLDRSV